MHKYTPTIKNTKHVNMFSKSTCTYESHSLQYSQQGRKFKYCIELHTTPQILQVANLESFPHIQHMWRGIVKSLYSKVVVGKETLMCILHPSCDVCIYDITLWKCPFYKIYILIYLIINKHNLLHKDPFCEILAPKSLISAFQGFHKTPHLSLALLKYEKKFYMASSILALQLPIHHVEKNNSHFP